MAKNDDDTGATPDQARAQEKRDAAKKRADDAAKESAKQEWPPGFEVVPNPDERSAPPKGRKGSDKTEA